MEDLSNRTENPIARYRLTWSPAYKRLIYLLIRPFLDFQLRMHLSPKYLSQLPPVSLVLHERGYSLETRRAWAKSFYTLDGKSVLVQGTGSGWDTLSWAEHMPGRIVAQDLYPFLRAWRQVREYANVHGLSVPHFLICRMEQMPLHSESIDWVVSDAVFEHCQHLEAVLRDTFRVLRPGGYIYAAYGPLWFCFGGDHYSGRGGLTHGYSHIELEGEEYLRYFESHIDECEDSQSGGRYVTLGLFSKLPTKGYLALYEKVGFQIVDLMLELSQAALDFRKRWPERFQKLLGASPNLDPEDFLIKANFVILRKP